MISEVFRQRLAAFAMTVMIAGPLFAVAFLLVTFGADPSGRDVGTAVGKAVELIVLSILSGGILRALISIDARLEQRS